MFFSITYPTNRTGRHEKIPDLASNARKLPLFKTLISEDASIWETRLPVQILESQKGNIFYSRQYLQRLYRRMLHPSCTKLYNDLK